MKSLSRLRLGRPRALAPRKKPPPPPPPRNLAPAVLAFVAAASLLPRVGRLLGRLFRKSLGNSGAGQTLRRRSRRLVARLLGAAPVERDSGSDDQDGGLLPRKRRFSHVSSSGTPSPEDAPPRHVAAKMFLEHELARALAAVAALRQHLVAQQNKIPKN